MATITGKASVMGVEVVCGIVSAGIGVVATWPYARDVLNGRAQPARSSRIMFAGLLSIACYQQIILGGGWALAVTAGELVSCSVLLVLALRHGDGGWSRTDVICYVLLGIDLLVWWHTGSALWGLGLTIVADIIAFWPTLFKTWHRPNSETPLWYGSGVVAGMLSVIAVGGVMPASIFPLYLALANLAEVVLIFRLRWQRFFFARESDIIQPYD